jgi:hypothetical protein
MALVVGTIPERRAAINERVAYVSPYRTGTYDAVVTAVNADSTVAVDVYLSGIAIGRRDDRDLDEPVIRLRAVTYGSQGSAQPLKGTA